jgi:hypothetical protein
MAFSLRVNVTHVAYPFIRQSTFGLFLPTDIYNIDINMCLSFCLNVAFHSFGYVGVEFLGLMLILSLNCEGIVKLFSTVGVPFYFSSRNVRGCHSHHILPQSHYFLVFGGRDVLKFELRTSCFLGKYATI